MPIHYVFGDATAPNVPGPKLIPHIVNDLGRWGSGFVVAVSRRWPEPEARYREEAAQAAARWEQQGKRPPGGNHVLELGHVTFVPVQDDITVCNMVAQWGIRTAYATLSLEAPIRYDALETCLGLVAAAAKEAGATVHMPRIGCGLAGGRWSEVGPIVERTMVAKGIDVYVYDMPSMSG